MAPPEPNLPSRKFFIKDLVLVAACSADSSCPIFKEEYDEKHQPVLLRPCGHIFGKPCILSWFEEGADTCPMDRNRLFTSSPRTGRNRVQFSLPASEVSNQRDATGPSNARGSGGVSTRSRSMGYLLFFSGEIIAVDGHITPNGSLRLVHDLWFHVSLLFNRLQVHPDELDPFSASDIELRGSIIDALPRGFYIRGVAWPLLTSVARGMLDRYGMAREEGSEATMTIEDTIFWGQGILNVCGRENVGE